MEEDSRNMVKIVITDFHPDSPWKTPRCVVRIHKATKIWDLKVRITEVKSKVYAPSQFRLFMGGKMLDDSKRVQDYGIVNETILNLSRERIAASPKISKLREVPKPEVANVTTSFSSRRKKEDFARIDADRLRKGVYVLKLEIEALMFLLHTKTSHEKTDKSSSKNKDAEISLCLEIIRKLIEKHGVDPTRVSMDEDERSAQDLFRDFVTVFFFERNRWPQCLRKLAKILSVDLKRFKLEEDTVSDMTHLASMIRAERAIEGHSNHHDTMETFLKRYEHLVGSNGQPQQPRRRKSRVDIAD